MDPGVVLNRGRDAVRSGQYKEALEDLVWFHDNALQHNRAYYGVRLSFALGYWHELAEVYPPAMEALESVRARTIASLRKTPENRELFHDFMAINRELGEPRKTYDLFRELWTGNPELAKLYGHLAVDSVVEVGDFQLASKCLPDPESYLLWLSDRLNESLDQKGIARRTALMRREAYVRNYCHDVQIALRILRGLRNNDGERAAREWAIALVGPKAARAMVSQRLESE